MPQQEQKPSKGRVRTMNDAFYNPATGRCDLGNMICKGPDCRMCNGPLIMKEELKAQAREETQRRIAEAKASAEAQVTETPAPNCPEGCECHTQ